MAASLLRSIDWDVTVFERAVGDLTGRGAGLGVSSELLNVMERIGVPMQISAGAVHNAYVWLERDGSVVFTHKRPTLASTWSRIYQPLRNNLPTDIYRQGMGLVRVEQDEGSVTANFADGSKFRGDLLVAADGVFSTVRGQYIPEIAPRYANYVAWRGIVEERDVPSATREMLAEQLVFCFPEGEMLLTMSVPGAGEDMRPGYRRIYFIWYRPVGPDELSDLFTDSAGKNHGISIPPPLIREELLHEMKSRAREIFAPAVAEVVNRVPQPLLQAVTDMESPHMTFQRVALIGDAAFVARPHTAGGVSKAALDAECLADSLAMMNGDIPAALANYERKQLHFGGLLVAHSRYLGAYLEGQTKPLDQRRGEELERDPRRIIQDYGAPDLLHPVDVSGFQPHD